MRRTKDESHLEEIIEKLPLTVVFGAEAGRLKLIGYHMFFLSYGSQSNLHADGLQYFLASYSKNAGESKGKQGETE